MRKPFSSLLAASTLLLGLTAMTLMSQESKPDAPQQARSFSKEVTLTLHADYLLFLPKEYAAKPQQKWPLILFLHGAGERGQDVWMVAMHGPPKIVKEKPDFPFIVVSPQCPEGQVWSNNTVLALVDEITAKYAVDKTRIYLTGLSMGGFGTWSLGAAFPERFAAIVPICGGGDPLTILLADPKKAAALKSLPVWAFHGGKDGVVKLAESERMVDAFKKIGCAEVQLTVYPETGHDSWVQAYNDPKLYDWLLAHSRKAAAP